MRVIFLDIDGVLNSEQFQEGPDYGTGAMLWGEENLDPKAVALLNAIVDKTGARIVISSSWRHIWSRDEIGRMLENRGFQHRDSIIDVTPSLFKERGYEIAQWLGQSEEGHRIGGEQVESYVILDDNSDFPQPELQDHFVQTNPEVGLTADDARRVIAILGA